MENRQQRLNHENAAVVDLQTPQPAPAGASPRCMPARGIAVGHNGAPESQLPAGTAARPSAAASVRADAAIVASSEPARIEATLFQAVLRRWTWLGAGGASLALAGLLLGQRVADTSNSAWFQLVRNELPGTSDTYKPRILPTLTLADMLRNPAFQQRVVAVAQPPIEPEVLARGLKVKVERDGDILTVTVSGGPPGKAVQLADTVGRSAVEFTRELQTRDMADEQTRMKQHLVRIETDLVTLNQELRQLPPAPLRLVERSKSLSNNLEMARAELANLKPVFNEESRRQKQSDKVDALEKQQHVISEIKEMEDSRLRLNARLRTAESLGENLPGYYRLLGPATAGDGRVDYPRARILASTLFGGVFGVLLTAGLILLVEFFDERLKTSADVARISQLPVLATLGELRPLEASGQNAWAVRAWIALQHQLNPLPNGARVCGFISSQPGEGRSTWVNLIGHAANQCGNRVLSVVIDSFGVETTAEVWAAGLPEAALPPDESALTSSLQVTERLIGPGPPTVVQISLPRWTWTLERRHLWQLALEHWRQIPNAVILVELPPASVSESLLLAESLPNLIWLVDAGKTTATELQEHLKAFRQARCHLIGAALNHELPPPRRNRFLQPAPATAA
jgi:hypothetical protein